MNVKIIEGTSPDGLYLKAAVCTFDEEEWARKSIIAAECGQNTGLLRQESWTRNDFWILDLSRPGPGGKFTMAKTKQDAAHALSKLPVTF